ncbi:hypothetical protein DWW03_08700 [Alistipes sp. AF14-19]|nr:hypothetical protein DWW03_08700 [Alistipes sp. AF14-19]
MLTEQFIQNTRQTITGCRHLPLGRRLYGHQTGVRPGFVERIAGFDPVMDSAAAAGVPVGGACRRQRRTARIQSARHSRRSNGGEQGKTFLRLGPVSVRQI